ncbi:MAG: hypothetical protein PVF96_06420 [Candidatus Bathyarchaeota archaeon]|jgi:hypothetical protein
MNNKNFPLPILLFSIILITHIIIVFSLPEDTSISVIPNYAHRLVNQSLIVNVTVNNVTDLTGWAVGLRFNPSVINCTELFIPPDNIFSGRSDIGLTSTIDNELGSLTATNALWEIGPGVTGSGKLFSVTFEGLTPGISGISIYELYGRALWNSTNDRLSFEPIDGAIQVDGTGFNLQVFGDVQVFSNSSITDFNRDSANQMITFNASGFIDTTTCYTVSIQKTFLNGTMAVLVNDLSLKFSNSTSNSTQYVYLQHQHTSTAPIQIKILTTIIGDITGDRFVDMRDIAIPARAFGTVPGDARWDPRGDVTGPDYLIPDGTINMRDVALVARNFGATWTP